MDTLSRIAGITWAMMALRSGLLRVRYGRLAPGLDKSPPIPMLDAVVAETLSRLSTWVWPLCVPWP